jgi:hypothetical protein
VRWLIACVLATACWLTAAKAAGPAAPLPSPASEVLAAAADILRRPARDREFLRYLSIAWVPDEDRALWRQVLAFHVNSLSRKPVLKRPVRVSPTLLVLDIRHYGWVVATYDKLADVDPHFHETFLVDRVVKTRKYWPGGRWTDGKDYAAGWFVEAQRKQVKEVRFASHLNTEAIVLLAGLTRSKAPILRADWFFGQTATAKNRVAGYYAFLQLTKRDDFDKLVGFNKALSDATFRTVATLVPKSGVSQRNRQIEREAAADAAYWRTKDQLVKQRDEGNALNQLDKDFKHQAERIFGVLPNELFGYYLCTDQGVQQDSAPDEVGPDTTATSNNGKIEPYVSCARCHKEGLRPIPDFARRLWAPGRGVLVAIRKEDQERLEQLYIRPFQQKLDADNLRFTAALAELNGAAWTVRKNSNAIGKAWKWAVDDDVSRAQAAKEIGVSEATLARQLWLYASPVEDGGKGQILPNSLQAYNREPPLLLLREHADEAFSLLTLISRGLVPGLRVKPR